MAGKSGLYEDEDLGSSVNGDTGVVFAGLSAHGTADVELAPPEPPLQCINFV